MALVELPVPAHEAEAFAARLEALLQEHVGDKRPWVTVVEILEPPAGTMGGSKRKILRIDVGRLLERGAHLATVIGLLLNACGPTPAPELPLAQEDTPQCRVTLTSASGETQADFPCTVDSPTVERLLSQHIDRYGTPESIQIRPPTPPLD